MKKQLLGILGTLAAVAAGCSADPGESVDLETGRAASPETTKNTVVAHVKLSASHAVEIVENETGIVLITEMGSIDGEKPILDEKSIRETSLVETVEKLQAGAIDARESIVDTVRLKALDEQAIATRLAQPKVPASAEEDFVEKAQSWGNFGGQATLADWTWWSTSVCVNHTYKCEVGLSGNRSFTRENAYIHYSFGNEHSTALATATLMWDPCYTASIFEFCTKPYKVLYRDDVQPRMWITHFSFNGEKYKWSMNGSGSLWEWAVTFDNPRTW